jgi:phospholipid transport system substrate-binding protein
MRVVWMKSVFLSLVLMAVALAPAYAADPAPTDPAAVRISDFYATLLDTMKHGKALGIEGRYRKLAPAIAATFDFATMSRFTVGPSWETTSAKDREAVIDAFRRLTIANYASNFASYDGQQFTVDPNVVVHGADRIVETKMIMPKGDPIAFNYRMREAGGSWKIVDVYLSGFASELATRRSDFASTVATGGAPALAKKLNGLADALLK